MRKAMVKKRSPRRRHNVSRLKGSRRGPLWDDLRVREALRLPRRTDGKPGASFSQVSTDSRSLPPRALFVALRGDNFNGHTFIPQAIARGATGVVCESSYPEDLRNRKPVEFYRVPDTLLALRALGKSWRSAFRIPLVAITGSVGKTTTKELLASILSGKWKPVLKTEASQNGYIGIPLTLLKLTSRHPAAAIEVGIDAPGAMREHIDLVEPTLALLTAIAPEHLEHLKNLETITQEEWISVAATLARGGKGVVNLDQPELWPLFSAVPDEVRKERLFGFTLGTPSRLAALSSDSILRGRYDPKERSLRLEGMGLDRLRLKTPLLGTHNARNLLGAVCAARALGLERGQILAGLRTFKGAAYGRSEVRRLPSAITVICDFYNANPSSMRAALDLMETLAPGSQARWVCLGDMLELGPEELKYHAELAGPIIQQKIDYVLLFGTRTRALAQSLNRMGFSGNTMHFATREELAKTLRSKLKPRDLVLIKGSRGMRMEEVWNFLSKSVKNTRGNKSPSSRK